MVEAKAWYFGPEYQEIKKLREGAQTTFAPWSREGGSRPQIDSPRRIGSRGPWNRRVNTASGQYPTRLNHS